MQIQRVTIIIQGSRTTFNSINRIFNTDELLLCNCNYLYIGTAWITNLMWRVYVLFADFVHS